LLAGRKILLADDSITIQKVVELSFADEGAQVLCVNNGREAIERLEEFQPDIVLADVFMPQVNGYELCEYIKQNEKLKHIPVMLLVGSFEPFNESEARRVGADDTLTKPFQSIRRLLEKVGLMAEETPPEEMIQTAEYPRVDQPEPQKLSDSEIELTTADTRQLKPELARSAPEPVAPLPESATSSTTDDAKMEPKVTDVAPQQERVPTRDELLDLGDFQQPVSASTEEFVLDIDLNAAPEAPSTDRYPAYVGRPDLRNTLRDLRTASFPNRQAIATVAPPAGPTSPEPRQWSNDQFAQTQDISGDLVKPTTERVSPESLVREEAKSTATAGMITLDQLSPEVIDAIARRAVEQLSEKAVQEIAWEVVPQLAELLIKRQLEEKNS
jgi:CheY-like chemotaxis protein